jgi:branched-chain amino acid aminotransferase
LEVLDISEPSNLRDLVLQAVDRTESSPTAIRLTVTRGIGAAGLMPDPQAEPTVIIVRSPIAFPQRIYEVGLSAHIASGRRNERSITAGLKTLAYVEAIAGMVEARRAGADEALFLDTADHCSEAAASNLFAWTGDTLVTPPVSCGILPGITRAIILDLAASLGITTAERILTPAELLASHEAFLTSSLRGIAPLVNIDKELIGPGHPGVLTRQLTGAYTAFVEAECAV